jgi:hypothetical protein
LSHILRKKNFSPTLPCTPAATLWLSGAQSPVCLCET